MDNMTSGSSDLESKAAAYLDEMTRKRGGGRQGRKPGKGQAQEPPQPAEQEVRTKVKKIPKTLKVVVNRLSESPWNGVIGFNEFRQTIEKRTAPPWEGGKPGAWQDRDTAETLLWLETETGLDFGRDKVDLAVLAVAHRNTFNPAQERLRALSEQWDGTPRLMTWLVDYLGAATSDGNREYIAEIGEKWLKGVAARVLFPGCKRDDVLVLRSAQGWNKSTAAQAISDAILPDAFTDSVDLGNPAEAKIQIRGIIIAELGELAGLAKAEVETVKNFVSTKSDHFREKFGRYAGDFPRTVSFIGSTNNQTFLKDPTGNRRWWPVTLTAPIDIPRLTAVLPQLLGEAARRVLDGEQWYVSAEVALEQADRVRDAHFEEDVWTDPVMSIVDDIESGKGRECPRCKGRGRRDTSYPDEDGTPGQCFKCHGSGKVIDDDVITIVGILDAMDIARQQQTPATQHRVSNILKVHGYEEARRWIDKKNNRSQRYWKKSTNAHSVVPNGSLVPARQEADKTGNHWGTTEKNPMVPTAQKIAGEPLENGQWFPDGSQESLGKQRRNHREPPEPLDSLYQTQKNAEDEKSAHSPIAQTVIATLEGTPKSREELERLVSHAHGKAGPALIGNTINHLMMSGAIARVGGLFHAVNPPSA